MKATKLYGTNLKTKSIYEEAYFLLTLQTILLQVSEDWEFKSAREDFLKIVSYFSAGFVMRMKIFVMEMHSTKLLKDRKRQLKKKDE